MKVDLKHIEGLAKLHVPNAEEMTKRLEGVLNYISELKESNFDADPVEDDHMMTISKERESAKPTQFSNKSVLKKNCPHLEEDQVVVPLFVDKS
jgi:Asp-tRNA(Asn)/Glu-tRNA(Gln) amidotransferase C subunit